jgi:hypothetical protein
MPPAPAGIGNAGRAAWRALHAQFEFYPWEMAAVVAYVQQVDRVAHLQAQVEADGQMVTGSKGQQVLHPGVGEARQGSLAAAKMLAELGLPVEQASAKAPTSSNSRRASTAALARWGRVRDAQEAGTLPSQSPADRSHGA